MYKHCVFSEQSTFCHGLKGSPVGCKSSTVSSKTGHPARLLLNWKHKASQYCTRRSSTSDFGFDNQTTYFKTSNFATGLLLFLM